MIHSAIGIIRGAEASIITTKQQQSGDLAQNGVRYHGGRKPTANYRSNNRSSIEGPIASVRVHPDAESRTRDQGRRQS